MPIEVREYKRNRTAPARNALRLAQRVEVNLVHQFVTVDNVANQTAAHNILALEFVDVYVRQIPQTAHCVLQSIRSADIALLHITIDNHLAVFANARQEHLHLRQTGVLRLIEDDEGFAVEGLTAHKSQGRSDDPTVTQAIIHCTRTEALIENIPEGINVDRKLLIQISRQKAQILSRLYRRPCQDAVKRASTRYSRLKKVLAPWRMYSPISAIRLLDDG